MNHITEKSKSLSVHEKINIRSWYSAKEDRNELVYAMTFAFLDIWTWNLKPYFKTN